MGMSFLGVGSGLDLSNILQQLEKAEKIRLTPIMTKKKSIDAKISGFGQLKGVLSKFAAASEKLQKAETFQGREVKGNDTFFSVKANNEVPLEEYRVEIDRIAIAHSIASRPMQESKTLLGNGDTSRTVVIEQANGNKMEISLEQDETSLDAIAKAINKGKVGETETSSMNAVVVRSGEGNYQLVITSKETGEKNAITSVTSSDPSLNEVLGYESNSADEAMTELNKAQDAVFKFNGITISDTSNTIKDIIPGLEITLKAQTKTEEVISVTNDATKTKEMLKEWVDAFNELQSTFSSLTKFVRPNNKTSTWEEDKKKETNGPLIGDSTLREIDNRIRSVFSHAQEGKYAVLSQVGINTDDKGKLVLNEKELDKVLDDDAAAVAKLFTGDNEKTGIANELVSVIKQYTQSKGTIENVTQGLKTTLKSLEKNYDQIEASIQHKLEQYRSQFTALDRLVASLNNTSEYLMNQFAAKK